MSAAYKSEHDGQIAARRLPQRIITATRRPRSGSYALVWTGLAQNPTAVQRCHHDPWPGEEARRIA
ncbi:hypothetical protein QRB38_18860 [Mycobacterium avium subsp. hominissuis]|nr:hypothetical protein [Mycobacterium avium]MDO2358672.1 hypothetical protein [Mycobacterium avium subsp. hominissuis]MDO2395843.1 hypothetical protein [Mycobacterium avium subsp. hominissuis]